MLDTFISQKFKFWSFISMVLLVFVHGYNLEQRYLQPWTTPGEVMTITSFMEYWLANGLFRFRIPMLFIISGYLYALHDQVPNKQRIGKRARTLLIPYLLWSGIAIAMTYALEYFSAGRELIERSHVLQIDATRLLIHDYYWYEVLARWVLFPVAYQLWFIRVLFVYNAIYPFIRWCVQHKIVRWVFFGVAFMLWLSTSGFVFIEGEGLLFFSLGVWIQKNTFDIQVPKPWLRPLGWTAVFIITSAVKTYLAFEGQSLIGDSVYMIITLLHKVTVVSGLVACWFGLDGIVRWCMSRQWFVWLSAFSFIIYALHAPLVAILIDGMFDALNYSIGYRMITFVLLPTLIVAGCIAVGLLLRKTMPGVYGVLTGGRGF